MQPLHTNSPVDVFQGSIVKSLLTELIQCLKKTMYVSFWKAIFRYCPLDVDEEQCES